MFARLARTGTLFNRSSFSFGRGGIHTWGNKSNLGRDGCNISPSALNIENIVAASMGKHHSAVVDSNGQIYTCGSGEQGELGNGGKSNQFLKAVGYFEHTGSVKSVDCGNSHTVVCTKDGEVYAWGVDYCNNRRTVSNPTRVGLPDVEVSQVAAGNTFTLALDKTGKKVFIWGSFKPLYSHENRSDLAANPTECHEISSVLKKTHSSIKKLKAAEGALAFLTDNGKLFVWGDSKFGQLAVNQMREDIFDTIVRKPEEVYHSYEGNIVDFDLSDNMMVFMTDAGKVYYSGLWKYFIPTELPLPKGVSPVSVAAGHDGFGVVDNKGRLLGWNTFVESKKKYFDLNLSVADETSFNGGKVTIAGGKYGTKFVVTA